MVFPWGGSPGIPKGAEALAFSRRRKPGRTHRGWTPRPSQRGGIPGGVPKGAEAPVFPKGRKHGPKGAGALAFPKWTKTCRC